MRVQFGGFTFDRATRQLLRGGKLEDLGSKNGTFLKEDRLDAPALLGDGDMLRLGRLLLVYRDSALGGSTKTERGGP